MVFALKKKQLMMGLQGREKSLILF